MNDEINLLAQAHICLDVRETYLVDKIKTNTKIHVSTAALDIGDVHIYCPPGNLRVIIERKSVSDLVASVKDGRYREQKARLLGASGLPARAITYLLEGVGKNEEETSLLYSTSFSIAFNHGFSVMRTINKDETCRWITSVAGKLIRDHAAGRLHAPTSPSSYFLTLKSAKKENMTPDVFAQTVLATIPGVSAGTAGQIIEDFGSIQEVRSSEGTDRLANLKIGKKIVSGNTAGGRKFGQKAAANVFKFLRAL